MDHTAIIKLWPNQAALTDDLCVSASLVGSWVHRRQIPSEYWRDVINAARMRGYYVTADMLIDGAPKRKERRARRKVAA